MIDLKNIEELGTNSFNNDEKLKNIIWSNKIKMLYPNMFSSTGVEEINIPNSIQSISSDVFSFCRKLKRVYIPNSVTTISKEAFYYCNDNLVIYCEAESKPKGWDDNWNGGYPVVWGCKSLPTD